MWGAIGRGVRGGVRAAVRYVTAADLRDAPSDEGLPAEYAGCVTMSEVLNREFGAGCESQFRARDQAFDASLAALAALYASPFTPTPLTFGGEPDCFFPGEGDYPYRGQDRAKARLDLHVKAMQRGERIKALFTGPAGTGKTTLARIVAARIQDRHVALGLPAGAYYELLPAQVTEKALLDQFMQTVAEDPQAIVFVDEVHTLQNLETLFHVLHDSGAARYPLSNGQWLPVPGTISWLAATTDPGLLDTTTGGAMRRRLEPEIRLDAPDADTLAAIVTDAGAADGLTVHPDAAYDIAERSVFPWQTKLIYAEARRVARVAGGTDLTPDHAAQAFDLMGLDRLGLVAEDRDVIAVLLAQPPQFTRSQPDEPLYKMSEGGLCAAAGVDALTFKQRIQPKLQRLGLLQVRGGQVLTPRAVQTYGGRALA